MSRNLRKKPRVSYAEPEEPSLDEYVFCSECRDYVYEYCSIHGPLLIVPDDKVPLKSPYPPIVPRAALTIPRVFLHLAPSIIPGAGLGVFTTLTLPSGVRFGPYRGKKTKEVTSTYCWQLYDRNGKWSHVVDADDANNSNWMRYVNCSRHWCEQNLVAFQYRGELYYRTIKIIPRFTELMVFYGGEFANMLHINIRKYNSPVVYAQKFGVPPEISSAAINKKPHTITSLKGNNVKSRPIVNQAKRVECDANKENQRKHDEKTVKTKANKPKNLTVKKKYIPPIKKTNEISNKSDIQNIRNNEVCDSSTDITEPVTKKAKYITTNIEKNNVNTTNKKVMETEPKSNTKQINVKQRDILLQNDVFCDICHYRSNTRKNLEKHLILHTHDKNLLKCSYCGYTTKKNCDLLSHLKTHTGEKPFSCNVCDYKCIQSGNLKTHMRSHTGEKPFSCNVCDYKCIRNDTLKVHMRIHTDEKPFSCNVCDYKCIQSSNLKIHMRSHTGEKPFSCNVCDYKCIQSSNLKIHMRIHTDEKPFSCNVCDYKCIQSSNLKIHMRSHTGEKPFSCNVCDYKCIKSGNLKRHMRSHTGEKLCSCNVCNYKCAQSGHLKLHMTTKHTV